jgi:hypothetical protein
MFFVSLLPDVHLHQSSKITRKSQYCRNQGFPCFLLVDGSIRIRNIGFIITVLAVLLMYRFGRRELRSAEIMSLLNRWIRTGPFEHSDKLTYIPVGTSIVQH